MRILPATEEIEAWPDVFGSGALVTSEYKRLAWDAKAPGPRCRILVE